MTSGVVPEEKVIVPQLASTQAVRVDTTEYETNNIIFGYLANVLAYTVSFYQPEETASPVALTNIDTSLNCFNWATFTGNTCTLLDMGSSNTVNHSSQKFDDITAPILVFVSLI